MSSEESTQNVLNDEQLQELMNRMSVEDRNELTGKLQKCSQEMTLTHGLPVAAAVVAGLYHARLKNPALFSGQKGWPFYAFVGIGALTAVNIISIETCRNQAQPLISQLYHKYHFGQGTNDRAAVRYRPREAFGYPVSDMATTPVQVRNYVDPQSPTNRPSGTYGNRQMPDMDGRFGDMQIPSDRFGGGYGDTRVPRDPYGGGYGDTRVPREPYGGGYGDMQADPYGAAKEQLTGMPNEQMTGLPNENLEQSYGYTPEVFPDGQPRRPESVYPDGQPRRPESVYPDGQPRRPESVYPDGPPRRPTWQGYPYDLQPPPYMSGARPPPRPQGSEWH
ncbi:unnamed protein product [Cylicocyclus nassatus]|uniref:Uncharacterized protein n=1 Tax=Cylicocyclus nassatus TaxID=53992 RepID=A0AA36DSM5_CYLNA|nr:unnamed protein product [Cylicocyclus nassatus]